MSKIISVCNLKGGAGKSTVAVNFACGLHEHTGETCVLIDADRQGTSKAWGAGGTLPIPVLTLTLDEARAEDRFPGMIWISSVKALADENAFIVIDLPAGLQYSLAAVTTVSDLILVPVNPSGLDFHSTRQFIDLIRKSRDLRGTGKPDCIIVPNRIDARTGIARDLTPYEDFGERISDPIHMRKAFSSCFEAGAWVGGLESGSKSHQEIGRLVEFVQSTDTDNPARGNLEAGNPATDKPAPASPAPG